MKDETQVKDEIILVIKETIAGNTSARDVDHIAEAVADRLYADGWRKRAEVAERVKDRQAEIMANHAFTIECRCTGLNDPECYICQSKGHERETAIPCLIEKARQQAEREIEEEERK